MLVGTELEPVDSPKDLEHLFPDYKTEPHNRHFNTTTTQGRYSSPQKNSLVLLKRCSQKSITTGSLAMTQNSGGTNSARPPEETLVALRHLGHTGDPLTHAKHIRTVSATSKFPYVRVEYRRAPLPLAAISRPKKAAHAQPETRQLAESDSHVILFPARKSAEAELKETGQSHLGPDVNPPACPTRTAAAGGTRNQLHCTLRLAAAVTCAVAVISLLTFKKGRKNKCTATPNRTRTRAHMRHLTTNLGATPQTTTHANTGREGNRTTNAEKPRVEWPPTPGMHPPAYHERQTAQFCQIHAINNLLGKHMIHPHRVLQYCKDTYRTTSSERLMPQQERPPSGNMHTTQTQATSTP